MITRVIIDVETGKVTKLLMAPDFHRAMSEDNIDMGEYLWSPDSTKLGLVSTDRFHKNSTAKLADVTTGEVRTLFTETEKTHVQTRVQWQILWDTNEVLWYSQRDGTAQMFPLRSQDRPAEESDHQRRGTDHRHCQARWRRRAQCGSTLSARKKDRIRISHICTRSASTERTSSR
jgi:hypothetical protein